MLTPDRSRFYVLRQDQNLVAGFDMTTLGLVAFLRTGNTPTQMAITADQKYLMVGNENSQIANVFDLDNFCRMRAPSSFPSATTLAA